MTVVQDKLIGIALLLGSIVGILLYGWLLWYFPTLILQITAFVAVASILGILGWIGWTMATTPAPAPIQAEPPSPPASTTQQSTPATDDTASEKADKPKRRAKSP